MTQTKKPKKWVTLTERADVAGEVRTPEEGSILIDGTRADELIGQKKAKASQAPKAVDMTSSSSEDAAAAAEQSPA